MTVLEQRFMETVPHLLGEIAKQMAIANKLKALELKGSQDFTLSSGKVDEALVNQGD